MALFLTRGGGGMVGTTPDRGRPTLSRFSELAAAACGFGRKRSLSAVTNGLVRKWAWRPTATKGVTAVVALLVVASLQAAPSGSATSGPAQSNGLAWSKCSVEKLKKFQCATLVVPMDYSNPSSMRVRIAVARARSTGGPGARIGSIIFNPGGPGGAGLPELPDLAASLSPQVRQRFDLVVFDPRGVGASRPLLECPSPPQVDSGETIPPQGWLKYYTEQVGAQASALSTCYKKNSPFIDYVGTKNVVRDVDMLRRELGDRQINYWGVSYGTRIGAVYAQMFPGQVRTMILDGNVPPNPTLTTFFSSTAGSRDTAFGFFQREYPEGAQAYLALVDRLKSGPAKLPDGMELTAGGVAGKLVDGLAGEKGYPALALMFLSWADELKISVPAASSQNSQPLPSDNGAQNAATAEPGGPDEESGNTAVLRAVNCIDLPGRDTPAQMAAVAAEAGPAGPRFSNVDLSFLPLCSGFPIRSDPTPQINVQGAPGALVVNGAFDPLTPLSWAQQMVRAIPNSRLLVYQGAQHGITYVVGSSCVDDVANTYLLTGQLPNANLDCPTVRPAA